MININRKFATHINKKEGIMFYSRLDEITDKCRREMGTIIRNPYNFYNHLIEFLERELNETHI